MYEVFWYSMSYVEGSVIDTGPTLDSAVETQ